MRIESGKFYGVVTGDIIGSTKLDRENRAGLFDRMSDGSNQLRDWLGDVMPLPVDIFSGDSWQFLLLAPDRSLAAALFYRAWLRASDFKVDTRFVIGLGTVDFVPGDVVSEGDGEAFRQSGRLLRDLKKRRMGFAAVDDQTTVQWDLVFQLIDAIVTNAWSQKRSLALVGALQGWKQEDIGTLWDPPIDQATVNRHLKAAGWNAVASAIDHFERFWEKKCL